MTKNKTIIIATIIMTVAAILVGCNQSEKVSEISTTQNTTLEAATVQTTNQASVEATVNSTTTAVESTTMKKTNQEEKESSTAKVTTTQKSKVANTTTTTKKTTTQKSTITKPTTTKPTTTKQETTTKKSRCTNNNNHSLSCGNMGKWFNSRAELKEEYMRVSDYWLAKYDNGEIDWDTYMASCPQGYECWSCSDCGKWTGNYK